MPQLPDDQGFEDISITVEATLTNPIVLRIPAKPAQIALVVGMAMEDLIRRNIVGVGIEATSAPAVAAVNRSRAPAPAQAG